MSALIKKRKSEKANFEKGAILEKDSSGKENNLDNSEREKS